jgi:hypothetical protein
MCLERILKENPTIDDLKKHGVQFDPFTGYPMAYKRFYFYEQELDFPFFGNFKKIEFLKWLHECHFRYERNIKILKTERYPSCSYKTGFHCWGEKFGFTDQRTFQVLMRNITCIGKQLSHQPIVLVAKQILILPPASPRKINRCINAF